MSTEEFRQELADTVTEVTGVQGYPYRPPSPRTGDAWPQWAGDDHDAQSGQFEASWRMFVMLPQDERAASQWSDEHKRPIIDALEPVVYVDRVQPGIVTTGAGDQMVMVFQFRGEM